ncbi:Protein of unknown function (DUF1501) [Olavius sp. associated proteobacterium Delta 1]|nr:Protein of unknown function (DUF1501) [Olavius sp. associated proteobacterium Delta 1]
MNRRKFLRTLVGAGAATAAFMLDNPFRPMFRIAHAAVGKTLVVIFQRGGCDGLNTVVPYGDGEYENLRPTIRIYPPDSSPPESELPAIDLNGFFGLHPSLSPLMRIWDAGDLAVLPTVHYPAASRSHFDGQHFIESAASMADRANKDNLDGWLNRHLATFFQAGQLRAVSFGSSVAQALRGPMSVSSFGDLARFDLGLSDALETALLNRLAPVYGQPLDPDAAYRQLLQESGGTVINNLAVAKSIDTGSYETENGADYPNTTYGRQLKQIAQLIKADVGLEMATVNIGGWDTHSNQGAGAPTGRQARRFQDFAGGIAALYTDLGSSRMANVMILTMTEFGRTSKENGSFGTDHGHAASWFVAGGGGRVKGGIHGDWPGLDDLERGRWLKHTVDYRDVLGEILTGFMENPDISVVYTDPNDPKPYELVGFIN